MTGSVSDGAVMTESVSKGAVMTEFVSDDAVLNGVVWNRIHFSILYLTRIRKKEWNNALFPLPYFIKLLSR